MPKSDAPMTTNAEAFIPPLPVEKVRGPALIPVANIDASGRVRTVNAAAAARLADSIDARGLIAPIIVRPTGEDAFKLVVGGHRLAAMAMLGWRDAPCDVRDLDDDEALDLELKENSDTHGLDKLDFGLFCVARQELDERLAARGKRGGDRRSDGAQSNRQVVEKVPRFTEEMAERLGRSERTIQRAIAMVRSLDPETIDIVRGTPVADNESKLKDLGREQNLTKRRMLAERYLAGDKTTKAARVALGDEEETTEDPQETHYGQLCRAWTLSDEKTRLRFLNLIDAAYLTAPAKPIDKEAAAKEMGVSLAPSRGGRRSAKGAPR